MLEDDLVSQGVVRQEPPAGGRERSALSDIALGRANRKSKRFRKREIFFVQCRDFGVEF
jgi:hypothetical protein